MNDSAWIPTPNADPVNGKWPEYLPPALVIWQFDNGHMHIDDMYRPLEKDASGKFFMKRMPPRSVMTASAWQLAPQRYEPPKRDLTSWQARGNLVAAIDRLLNLHDPRPAGASRDPHQAGYLAEHIENLCRAIHSEGKQ